MERMNRSVRFPRGRLAPRTLALAAGTLLGGAAATTMEPSLVMAHGDDWSGGYCGSDFLYDYARGQMDAWSRIRDIERVGSLLDAGEVDPDVAGAYITARGSDPAKALNCDNNQEFCTCDSKKSCTIMLSMCTASDCNADCDEGFGTDCIGPESPDPGGTSGGEQESGMSYDYLVAKEQARWWFGFTNALAASRAIQRGADPGHVAEFDSLASRPDTDPSLHCTDNQDLCFCDSLASCFVLGRICDAQECIQHTPTGACLVSFGVGCDNEFPDPPPPPG